MSIGWNRFFESDFEKKKRESSWPDDFAAGRVIGEERTHFRVQLLDKRVIHSELSGQMKLALLKDSQKPVVGDWVVLQIHSSGERAIVQAILSRQNQLSRNAAGEATVEQILASNVDGALILTSLDNDFSVNRIQRYVALVQACSAEPIIVLTKSDVAIDKDEALNEIKESCPGVSVVLLSSISGEGIEDLKHFLKPNSTFVLLGSSGVGKSTLVNTLLGQNLQSTRSVREQDSKGRHTTSGRHLLELSNGAVIIDTPGLREVQLWLSEESLDSSFDDIASLALKCKFTDCKHELEPGCAIQNALSTGELTQDRLNNYTKMLSEVSAQERRRDKAAGAQYRKGLKKLNKDLRVRLKEKGRK